MLNIWKRSSHPKAETYLFPDTEELESKELETAEAEEPLPPMEEPEQSRISAIRTGSGGSNAA